MARNRGEAFDRFSRAVDGPMMLLALAMIPLIVVPVVVELSPDLDRALLAVDYLIWAAFAIEYLIKLYLAPQRRRFVKANIPDLIIVVVPMLRPLRILRSARLLRLLRLTRLVAFAVEGLQEAVALQPGANQAPLPPIPQQVALWVMSHLSTIPLGPQPSRSQPVYRGLGCLPTGGRPVLFLALSASLVSKP